MANPGNVARGLKAAVSNPNNSEEAKERAQARLDEMEQSGEAYGTEAHNAQVRQGHKAATNNPNVSDEVKQRSAQAISNMN
ncbi:uncharacterized protein C8Q71DRAFT_908085 [Rhodofomes roseus]|uniref:Uncharacterized protein n=1 Tax=Rhodofomes roseus TaxID=34475 RepID=A0A4Y9Y1G8_9APHY|nr:uncharacterized protein C8Q71DRAFT_908085 [Rhodofomes roseus]KAH9835649.1 hypothetical protein C8Q71DRAFT_908085 [Rhodofomes roseus]TFY55417.1 hypothetical protein EVJ58_g8272 [Rhodofomes roseus]